MKFINILITVLLCSFAAHAEDEAELAAEEATADAEIMNTRRQHAEDQAQREAVEIEAAKNEAEKLGAEVAKEEASLAEAKAKLERTRLEHQTLQELKFEKSARLQEIAREKEQVALEMKELEAQRVAAEQEFQRLKQEEKIALEDAEREKAAHALKKAPLAAEVAEMKARNRELASTLPKREELTLSRKCRVFDKVGRDAKVLGVQPSGAAISKRREGKNFYTFTMEDGSEGYVAKRCFE